jgi:hypothetical protein
MGGFGFIFWLLLLAVIIAALVWFVRSQPLAGSQRRSTSLEVLEERYARGRSTAPFPSLGTALVPCFVPRPLLPSFEPFSGGRLSNGWTNGQQPAEFPRVYWLCYGEMTIPAARPCTHKSRLASSGWSMSALPPKADIRQRIEHVCFVP